MRQMRLSAVFATLLLLILPAAGQNITLRGQVLMEDGTPPGKSINIEKYCSDSMGGGVGVARTLPTGKFLLTTTVDALRWQVCVLRAQSTEFDSTSIEISHLNSWSDPNLPAIILHPRDSSAARQNDRLTFASSDIPPNARQPWNNA